MLIVLSGVILGDVALMSLIGASLQSVGGWATFVPDLVVGLITTAGFGLVLWLVTHRIESNLDRREAERAARSRWSVVRRRLANAVNTLEFVDDFTDASNLGPVADRVVELLQDEPLSDWARLLDASDIAQLDRTLAGLEKTISMGNALNDAIRFWYRMSPWPVRVSQEQVSAILIGTALGFDRDVTARTMGVRTKAIPRVLGEIDARAKADLDNKLLAYALHRRTAEERVSRLRSPQSASA